MDQAYLVADNVQLRYWRYAISVIEIDNLFKLRVWETDWRLGDGELPEVRGRESEVGGAWGRGQRSPRLSRRYRLRY